MLIPYDGPDAILCNVCDEPRFQDDLMPYALYGAIVCTDCDGPHLGD